ncbi:MAG: TlpA disulfide reductase family protein [Candidatus Sericytochromatia bacterium]|nr:TlpA disulfide reductase family protein [Candidatus Sericytochromatia bacterium]
MGPLLRAGLTLALTGLAPVLGVMPVEAADKTAPAFDLPVIATSAKTGAKRVSLASLKGKVVLVNFWATWCPPCRHEIPDLIRLQDDLKGKGFTVLGISLDDDPQGAVPGFVKEFGAREKVRFNYPLLVGNEDVARGFGGIRGIPTTFLLDRKGVIRQRWIGPPGEEHAEILANFHKAIKPLL